MKRDHEAETAATIVPKTVVAAVSIQNIILKALTICESKIFLKKRIQKLKKEVI